MDKEYTLSFEGVTTEREIRDSVDGPKKCVRITKYFVILRQQGAVVLVLTDENLSLKRIEQTIFEIESVKL